MIYLVYLIFQLCFALSLNDNVEEGFCQSIDDCPVKSLTPKYVLYDVNEPEGFNLKRDVYIRMATFIKGLSLLGDWHLVLPPWYNLYHWRSPEYETGPQNNIPWGHFFDISSLQAFAPVMEYKDFLQETHFKPIDYVFTLQHLTNNLEKVSEWKEGWAVEKCHKETVLRYEKIKDIFLINILGVNNVTANHVNCISFHGTSNLLKEIVLKYNARSILFHHAEVVLHNNFGDKVYWQCRRSMRFAPYLVKIALEFRQSYLNSSDISDKTEMPSDWRLEEQKKNAIGGPYLAVHLRRRDFVWGRSKDTPSLMNAAKQIKEKLIILSLDTVFVATDAPEQEYEELQSYLTEFRILRYIPSPSIKKKLKDGGVAIIDQIICSHARFFIGSYESTFSFRIQEEREILGFKKKTTFIRFCGDEQPDCTQPTKWTIVH